MEEFLDYEEAPHRFKLVEVATSVFSTLLMRQGVMHGVASFTTGENEVGAVYETCADIVGFCRRVHLTATAARADRLAVLWPNAFDPVLTIPMMYHRRKLHPTWSFLSVSNSDKGVKLWWRDNGWWEGGSAHNKLIPFQLKPDEPTDTEVEFAVKSLAEKPGHGKLPDFLSDSDTAN